ncbi:MAG: RNA polymerase sigma factor [Planctomycetota bacterium]
MPENPPEYAQTVHLLGRARKGDMAAYDQLFEQSAPRLELYLRVRLGKELHSREESRDLLQETYLAAHQDFSRFEDRGQGSFGRWLCQIAENQIRSRADYHGAKKRRPPQDLARVSQVIDRLEADDTDVLTIAGRNEQRAKLAAAIATLPTDERDALLMRHFEGREIAEIAARTGMSPTSCRRLIGRATVRLGGLIDDLGAIQ